MSSHEATVKPTDHVESGSTLNINAGAGMQRNYALNGGSNVRQFNSDVLNYTMNNVYPDTGGESPVSRLPVATQASFDSSSKQDDPLCLPGTRTQVLKQIKSWIYSESGSCVFWLNGMAGTGKSTIARTVCRDLRKDDLLGGSFFFVRDGGDVANARLLFTTLAKQLVAARPLLVPPVSEAICKRPDIASVSRKEQWETLILHPLMKTKLDPSSLVLVLVIDALDECGSEDDMRGIITLLAQADMVKGPNLRVIITSRPETPIRLGFGDMPSIYHRDLLLHELPREVVDADICLFLYHEFEEVKKRQTRLHNEWPGVDVVNQLVLLSAGLFIFAATICRFVLEEDQSATESLKLFLPEESVTTALLDSRDVSRQGESTSYLDSMYSQILKRSVAPKRNGRERSKEEISSLSRILGAVAGLNEPLRLGDLARLMKRDENDTAVRLDKLHSVIRVSGGPGPNELPVRLYHASFREFLFDSSRCQIEEFCLASQDVHRYLLQCCLDAMESNLKRDICHLSGPGVLRNEISRAEISHCIPSYVQYACCYWTEHGRLAGSGSGKMIKFLQKHLLHWIEAMSLLGRLSKAVQMLKDLSAALESDTDEPQREFAKDASRFLLFSLPGVEQAPLQIYESALLFAPTESQTRQIFRDSMPAWVSRKGVLDERWDQCMQVLEGHSDFVVGVAFSPDGNWVASASKDRSVRLWDPENGTCKYELEGHTDAITAVKFSPTNKILASGSDDGTLRLWDVSSGICIRKFIGHSDSVTALAFLENGEMLISASGDASMRLWVVATGLCDQEFRGHSALVAALAVSPDEKTVASASFDNTVRVWSTFTGRCTYELAGHSDFLTALTFSPAGNLIASASYDRSIILWNIISGAQVHKLGGHSGIVTAVAFSSSGKMLASGSSDRSVRLWHASGGYTICKFEGHTDHISNIAFSPCESFLASAADDQTVRLWSVSEKQCVCCFTGHTSSVSAIAISPDGETLASTSHDKTVRLWTLPKIGMVRDPESSSRSVSKEVLSTDTRTLATIFNDRTVRFRSTESLETGHFLGGPVDEVNAIAFSPDGKSIGYALHDGRIALLDAEDVSSMRASMYLGSSATAIAFSADGDLVASASKDAIIQVWDARTGKKMHAFTILPVSAGSVQTLDFTPDGNAITAVLKTGRLFVGGLTPKVTAQWPELCLQTLTAITFSKYQQSVVSASYDGKVRVLGLTQEHRDDLLATLNTTKLAAIALSSNGGTLAVAYKDNTLVLHDTSSRTVRREFSLSGTLPIGITAVAFSPVGDIIALAFQDGSVALCDTTTGSLETILRDYDSTATSIALLVDYNRVASASQDGVVRLWNIGTREIQRAKCHDEIATAIAFSPNMELVASSFRDGTVRLCDTAKGAVLHSSKCHESSVVAVAFSSSGRLLASASCNGRIRLLETETGIILRDPWRHEGYDKHHLSSTVAITFSPDEQMVASMSRLGEVLLWHVMVGSERCAGEDYGGKNAAATFPSEMYALQPGSGTTAKRPYERECTARRTKPRAYIWTILSKIATTLRFALSSTEKIDHDVQSDSGGAGRPPQLESSPLESVVLPTDSFKIEETAFMREIGIQNQRTADITISQTDSIVAMGHDDGSITLWSLKAGAPSHRLKGHKSRITALAYSPDGKLLASASNDRTLRLWKTETGHSTHELCNHTATARTVRFSQDGRSVFSVYDDHSIKVWDAITGACKSGLGAHHGKVVAMEFSPGGETLASVSRDQTVKLWNVATGLSRHELRGHKEGTTATTFSLEGSTVASASSDGILMLWDTTTGTKRCELAGHKASVTAIAFSPCAGTLATASRDRTIKLWETGSEACRCTLQGHNGIVTAVTFSPCGQKVASGSSDRTVKLWSAETGTMINSFDDNSHTVTALAFSQDGETIAAASAHDVRFIATRNACSVKLLRIAKHSYPTRILTLSSNGSTLITDVGYLSTDSTSGIIPGIRQENCYRFCLLHDWLFWGPSRILWIPPKYRASCSAVFSGTLAIGHTSGHVSLLSLDSSRIPDAWKMR